MLHNLRLIFTREYFTHPRLAGRFIYIPLASWPWNHSHASMCTVIDVRAPVSS